MLDAMRVVRMKNGKFAIQRGYEDCEDRSMDWDFETGIVTGAISGVGEHIRLMFETEAEANKHVQKWIDDNRIIEVCMEVYLDGSR